jgi:hypothetical protein
MKTVMSLAYIEVEGRRVASDGRENQVRANGLRGRVRRGGGGVSTGGAVSTDEGLEITGTIRTFISKRAHPVFQKKGAGIFADKIARLSGVKMYFHPALQHSL